VADQTQIFHRILYVKCDTQTNVRRERRIILRGVLLYVKKHVCDSVFSFQVNSLTLLPPAL